MTQPTRESEPKKERCLCGKWWAIVGDDGTLRLPCKLCKRDIVVRASGDQLEVSYE